MIHPATELRWICPDIGHGVVATEPIPAGTITWTRCALDRVIPPGDMADLPPMLREAALTYCFRDRRGHYLLCWDLGRYLNHSFRPNCLATAYGFEVAIRDIATGEELTNDYGTLNLLEPFCPSDEDAERTWVYPDDLLRFGSTWDRMLEPVFPLMETVPQPLRPLLPPDTWATCLRIAHGNEPMTSLKHLACLPSEAPGPEAVSPNFSSG
jgi:hypothetical protein